MAQFLKKVWLLIAICDWVEWYYFKHLFAWWIIWKKYYWVYTKEKKGTNCKNRVENGLRSLKRKKSSDRHQEITKFYSVSLFAERGFSVGVEEWSQSSLLSIRVISVFSALRLKKIWKLLRRDKLLGTFHLVTPMPFTTSTTSFSHVNLGPPLLLLHFVCTQSFYSLLFMMLIICFVNFGY